MKNRLDEIAEEYAEVFKRMNWQWRTVLFKGVPCKDEIKKDIIYKIKILKEQGYNSYITSGRIMVSKELLKDEDGTYWRYSISLDDKSIGEDEVDDLLESLIEIKG